MHERSTAWAVALIWVIIIAAALTVTSANAFLSVIVPQTFHDDEGYVMITQQAFNDGLPLYDDIFSQYGPAFYIVKHALLAAIGQSDLTHNANRILAMGFAAGTSLLMGLAAWRCTRDPIATSLVFLAVSRLCAKIVAAEPGHPQEFLMLFFAVMVLVFSDWRWTATRGVILGICTAVLALTKINAGAFAIAALTIVLLAETRPQHRSIRLLWRFAALVLVAMPAVLMKSSIFPGVWQLGRPPEAPYSLAWVWLALTLTCGLASWLSVASIAIVPSFESTRSVRRTAAALAIAMLTAAAAICVYTLIRGTSPTAFVDAVVLRPMRFSSAFAILPIISERQAAAAFLSLAAAVWIAANPSWLERTGPAYVLAVVQILLGCSYLWPQLAVVESVPLPGNFTYPYVLSSWAWVLLVPTSRSQLASTPRLRTSIGFISLLSILTCLYAYPVAGSQRRLVAVFSTMVAALLLYNGAMSLLPNDWRRSVAGPTRTWTTRSAAACVSLVTGLAMAFGYPTLIRDLTKEYSTKLPARHLHGAGLLRMDRSVYAVYASLVANVRANTDSYLTFLTLFGHTRFNSLHFWSEQPPPTYLLGSIPWHKLLTQEEKQRTREALEAGGRTGLVVLGRFAPDGYLEEYFKLRYAPALTLGDFTLYLQKEAVTSQTPTWLLAGRATFGSAEDQLPLIDGLFQSRFPCTLSLWFRTEEPGVVLGLQRADGVPKTDSGQPAIYVGLDGQLYAALTTFPERVRLAYSAGRVDDGQWHHLVLQLSETQRTLFLDGQELGSATADPGSDFPVQAQLGWGRWVGSPSTDNREYLGLYGELENAVLLPGMVEPGQANVLPRIDMRR